MAGLSGPVRSDCQPGVMPGSGDGDVILATGGSTVRPGVSPTVGANDCSNTFGSSAKGLGLELCWPEK